MLKTVKILLGTSLVLSMSTAIAAPAKANPETGNLLISQLLGHDRYDGGSQINGDDYQMGKVVAKVGDLATIKLADDTVTTAKTSARSGDNVIVMTNDNGDYVVEPAHPTWIDDLKEDYNVTPW